MNADVITEASSISCFGDVLENVAREIEMYIVVGQRTPKGSVVLRATNDKGNSAVY